MQKELSTIAKGAGFYFAGFAISKVLAYLYKAMIARGLGPEAFGVFSIGVVIAGIVTVLAAFGLHQGIMHFVAVYNSTGKKAKVLGTILLAIKTQLAVSVIMAAALFFSADWLAVSFFNEPGIAIVLRVLAVSMPFSVMTSAFLITAQAFKKIEYKIAVRNIIENVAKLLFTGILLFLGFEVFGATLGLALSAVVAFIFSFYFVQKKVFPIIGSKLKPEYNASELFRYSWPLLAVGFFDIIMYSIDTIMLGSLSTVYAAGLYNVALPTANLLVVASFAFESLFLPITTGLYAQGRLAEFSKMYKVVTRWIYATIFPALLFTVLFAREILAIMFGDVYAAGASALIILALGIFLVSFVGPVRSILESVGKTKLIFVNTVICGIINISLNLWLIPLFGATGNAIIGAAIATAFTYFLWNFLALAEVFIFTKMHPYSKAYIVPTIAACVSIAAFIFIKQAIPAIEQMFFPLSFISLVVLGSTFMGLYGLLFIILRGLQPEDIDVLRAVEAKTGIRIGFVRDFVRRFS